MPDSGWEAYIIGGMIPRRLYEHIKSHNWFAVAVDFFIVVVGVFVGVQVNEWWTSRTDARREHAYLEALKEDFNQIKTELDHDTREFEAVANSMITLLEQSRLDEPTLSVAELNKAFSAVIYMIGTRVVADTYDNLTGSGDLRLIRNQELKNQLAAFYAQARLIQLVGSTHELQLVSVFQPYIVGNLDYLSVFDGARIGRLPPHYRESMPKPFEAERILRALRSPEFRNVVAVKFDIATDSIDVIHTARQQAAALTAVLDAELVRR